ncbi:MAG: glutamate synthase small chain [Thermoleophilaceae bacterium]|nr:glutamate synthase small chain [Thermoleophilaceae bacterium]
MADPRGFLELRRVPDPERDPAERIVDHGEIFLTLPQAELREQGTRCMDCGVPFCHSGCPLGNLIPEWNELVRQDRWREAIDRLHATNNFPEFTGLICPAPCESSCVLAINDDPVMIKQIEWAVIERGFREGWVSAKPAAPRTGYSVAVVGSGPAGMAAAEELNAQGHLVTVYERDEAPGGLLRFGVPDFKLEKWMVDRRIDLLKDAGVEFRCGVDVGGNVDASKLRTTHDALVLAIGARVERTIELPGDHLAGIHPAMDYLYQRNRWVAASQGRESRTPEEEISAAGKRVVVIGGGDTAADCVASAHRECAASVMQLDTYPPQQGTRAFELAEWPEHPKRKASTYALDEGGELHSSLRSTAFVPGDDGRVAAVRAVEVGPPPPLEPRDRTERELPADLVLIAIGFTGPEQDGAVTDLGVELDGRGNLAAAGYAASVTGVFTAGDARRGQSLVVWAIAEGRGCAAEVDRYLGGRPA